MSGPATTIGYTGTIESYIECGTTIERVTMFTMFRNTAGTTSTIRIARGAALGVATLIGSGLSSPPAARAAYTVTLEQEGSNVVASGSGTINLAALFIFDPADDVAQIIPDEGVLFTGPTSVSLETYYAGAPITGPTSFGGVGGGFASSGSGDIVGISGGDVIDVEQIVAVPRDYVSGAALSDTSTYDNATLASLGATPGSYTWTWGSGPTADSFTLDIVAPTSAPEPGSLPLLVVGLTGLGMVLRKRRV